MDVWKRPCLRLLRLRLCSGNFLLKLEPLIVQVTHRAGNVRLVEANESEREGGLLDDGTQSD